MPGSSIPSMASGAAMRLLGLLDEIRVGAIVRVLDGPLAPIRCASVTAYRPCDDCGDVRKCTVRLVMAEARNAVAHILDNYTLAEMRALKEPLQLADMYDI